MSSHDQDLKNAWDSLIQRKRKLVDRNYCTWTQVNVQVRRFSYSDEAKMNQDMWDQFNWHDYYSKYAYQNLAQMHKRLKQLFDQILGRL